MIRKIENKCHSWNKGLHILFFFHLKTLDRMLPILSEHREFWVELIFWSVQKTESAKTFSTWCKWKKKKEKVGRQNENNSLILWKIFNVGIFSSPHPPTHQQQKSKNFHFKKKFSYHEKKILAKMYVCLSKKWKCLNIYG